jgi:hypothetical protein
MSGSHKSNRINPGEAGVVAFARPIPATRSVGALTMRFEQMAGFGQMADLRPRIRAVFNIVAKRISA